MRVLFVNPGGDAAGGAERSLALLIRGLAGRGHQLGVITLLPGTAASSFASEGAAILANGVGRGLGNVERHGSSSRFARSLMRALPDAVTTASRIRSESMSFGADVIHTNGLRAHGLTPMLASRDRRVVWSLRERPPGSAARVLISRAARRASAITAPSAFAASPVSGCRRPVHVIPNPVVGSPDRDRPAACRSIGLPPGRPIVAVVAHLHPTKGHHVAIAAWQHLPNPRPLLVLAGGDLYGAASGAYRDSLRDDIDQKGLRADVLMPGLVHDMPSLYAACDLVVHPALHPEGFGRSIAEGQIAGVPVIATAIGGALELIEDGLSGLLVPPGDRRALADAIVQVIGDPTLAGHLREGGLTAGKRYEPAAHAASMEAVYRAVLR